MEKQLANYRGIIYYTNGETSEVCTYSRAVVDDIKMGIEALQTVTAVWFANIDSGNGYDWDKQSQCWQQRLF